MIDLQFAHVSKRYRIFEESQDAEQSNSLVRKFDRFRRRSREFWAVHDVSFDIHRAEAVGIIGHNGAGKSTILKLLSNITTPTRGQIVIRGRLSALIEVGSGFHPELTGRENIYLSGSILGMHRSEISKKLQRIIDFAELRPFIDVPVKRYSSGMYVRLGFSIAAHLEPDILLLDEVLAVGDAAFQAKCIQRILEMKNHGTTIVFISHDLPAVERLCDRVLLMQRGELIDDGVPHQIIGRYQQITKDYISETAPNSGMTKEAEILSVSFQDENDQNVSTFFTGKPLKLEVGYVTSEAVDDVVFEVFFYSPEGKMHCMLTTEYGGSNIDLHSGSGIVAFHVPGLGLLPDIYHVDIVLKQRGALAGSGIDWRPRCATIRVDPGRLVRGSFYHYHEWKFIPDQSEELEVCLRQEGKDDLEGVRQ